jgi:hypothetical protein
MAANTHIWDGGGADAVYTTVANWQGDAAPEAGDSIILPAGNTKPIDGLTPNATALVAATIQPGYTGAIGSMTEGLPAPLQLCATTVNLAGAGQSFIDLKANSTSTCNVAGAAASPGEGQFGLALSSADAIANLNIDLDNGQSVGVAALAGQTGTFTNVNIDGGGVVTLGSGMGTITALTISGTGTVYIDCTYTTLTINGNPTVYQRSGAGTTLICRGGQFYNNTTGTIATTTIFPGASVICTDGPQARAMTTITNYGGLFDDSNAHTTWTAINRYCGDECFKLGTNWKMGARAAI